MSYILLSTDSRDFSDFTFSLDFTFHHDGHAGKIAPTLFPANFFEELLFQPEKDDPASLYLPSDVLTTVTFEETFRYSFRKEPA